MTKFAILSLLVVAFVLSSCGSVPVPTTVISTTASGNWEAQLTGGTGQAALLNFVTNFQVTDVGPLTINGFNFINTGTCFVTQEQASGSAQYTTAGDGQVTGNLDYQILSRIPTGNTLKLKGLLTGTTTVTNGTIGTLTNGAVTGTWTLTGSSDCGGSSGVSGTFTMCQAHATCTPSQ
jgi:hypothetical protein